MEKLKLIELFAGIGSQTQALKNIGVEHDVVAISEIDKYALQSYTALHGTPNNLGDICTIKELPKADIWTYSFPCQDISVAGKGAGIKEGTRSGLLFEVERLLKVARDNDTLPKYLLLENVKNLVNKKFRADFDSWLLFLEELGYKNYWQILNAKDYGIPQQRQRVFCVSIRGDAKEFKFPDKQELKLRLKDMLESEVDDKYYLKDSIISSMLNSNYNQRRVNIHSPNDISNCLCARDYKEPKCVQVGELMGEKWEKMHDISRRVYEPNGISPTVHCQTGGNTELKIVDKEKTQERFFRQAFETMERNDCKVGDTVDAFNKRVNKSGVAPTITTRPEGFKTAILPVVEEPQIVAMRGRNPDNPRDRTKGIPLEQRLEPNSEGICNTLTTVQKDNLVMESFVDRKYKEFIDKKGYVPEFFNPYNRAEIGEVSQTITAQCGGNASTSTILKKEECGEKVMVRKLTPRECLRLMGWNDSQIDKIQNAGLSNTQQYKQAGNGIVVQVLEAIFRQLFLA